LQSQVAAEMARETRKQVELATRMETQSKSILIFTIVTVIFLPLSFFTSYFGEFRTLRKRWRSGS
jgi:Mg2+ and Co2+ transporter CorA